MKRPPIKLELSKEWYLRMAKIEEECGCDVSAGKPIFYPPSITGWTPPEPEKPKAARTEFQETLKSRFCERTLDLARGRYLRRVETLSCRQGAVKFGSTWVSSRARMPARGPP